MGIIRRKYDEEFKRSAVKLVEEEGAANSGGGREFRDIKRFTLSLAEGILGRPEECISGTRAS